jgi:hypothetical protein
MPPLRSTPATAVEYAVLHCIFRSSSVEALPGPEIERVDARAAVMRLPEKCLKELLSPHLRLRESR